MQPEGHLSGLVASTSISNRGRPFAPTRRPSGVVSVEEECVLLDSDLLEAQGAFACRLGVGAVGPEVALEM